jgi:predicted porin
MRSQHPLFQQLSASKLSLACALALLLMGNAAHAQGMEDATPSLSFRGFGTVGVAHSTEDKADFLAQDLQGTGAGLGRSWSPDIDTRLGAQLDANFTSQLSGVVQITVEQRYDGSYNPQVEWANLKYQVTPDFSIRAGRIVLPILMVSDSRRVGYAQPWVRPPVELYSLIPLTNSDGVDMSYRMSFGEVNNTVRVGAILRDINEALPDGGDVVAKDGWQISNALEYGDASLHMAYTRTKLTVEAFKPLFDGYRQFASQASQAAGLLPPPFGPAASRAASQATALAEKYDTDNKRFEILSIGGSYDPGNWFVMAEWAQTEQKSVLGKRQAWYATGGYRFGSFTPYLTYAESKFKNNQSDAGITSLPAIITGNPLIDRPVAGLNGGATELNAGLNEQLAGAPIQKTVSVGVRWDFARNTALKLQYDRTNIGSGSTGTLDHAEAGYKLGGGFEVFSATLDFVF